MKEITFTIKQRFGVLSENNKGWSKQVNLISWNGAAPKIDIRDWSADNSTMSKGLTLTVDEAKALKELLNKIDI